MARKSEDQLEEIALMLRRIAYATELGAQNTDHVGVPPCESCGCTLMSRKSGTCPVCNFSSE